MRSRGQFHGGLHLRRALFSVLGFQVGCGGWTRAGEAMPSRQARRVRSFILVDEFVRSSTASPFGMPERAEVPLCSTTVLASRAADGFLSKLPGDSTGL